MSSQSGRALFRSIMRLHKQLPAPMQAVGNGYVRDEFRRHKSATPAQAKAFMDEWRQYHVVLQEQLSVHSNVVGQRLQQEDVARLSDEQLGQLFELHNETTKSGVPGVPGDDVPARYPQSSA